MVSKHGDNEKKSNWGKYIIVIIIILVIVAIAISVMFKSPKKDSSKLTDERLISTWTTDGTTVYEFESNGKGAMKVPSSEYKFTYVINDNKIYIDFESDKATDSDYEYSFEGDKLILKGIKSTTGEYTFTKNN
ncbi:MAG: hypothetical protein IKF83_02485 [Clostridia bacterium]|nr:hypothetical protein [Clostridia bacterium]